MTGRQRIVLTLLFSFAACSGDGGTVPETKPPTRPTRSCNVTLDAPRDADGVQTPDGLLEIKEGQVEFGELGEGEYPYLWTYDGDVEDPPDDTFTMWVGDVEYRALAVGDCRKPALSLVEANIVDGALAVTLQFQSATDGPALDPESVVVQAAGAAMDVVADAQTGVISVSSTLGEFGKYTLTASAADAGGNVVEHDVWLPLWHEPTPRDWRDATMYLVFTDRFRDTDGSGAETPDGVESIAGFQGGDFAGVTAAIEEGYFDEMGVTALWLSPIYENPDQGFVGADGVHQYTGYHGYWPVDPFAAESRLGGDDALRELVAAAHARGIRVVLDVVLNHVHESHPYCENDGWCASTCVCGTEGCGYDEKPRICQFAPYLPDLDYRNHELTRRVSEDVLELVRKFDIDALRIDAAKHMDRVITRRLRLELQAIEDAGGAPFWLIGETFSFDRGEIMQFVNDSELHGQFDFPLFGAIRGTFAQGGSFRDLEGAAAASQREYGPHYSLMSPFLGNHDVERFATLWAGNNQGPFGNSPDLMAEGGADVTQWDLINRMSQAFLFVLTQPGVPLVYYGDEVGLAGSGDPDNRRFMPDVGALNANQTELLARVQQIGQLRQEIAALRRGGRKELWLDDDFYVYVRDAGDDIAIIAMNKGSERTAEVQIPSALGVQGATFVSRNSDRSYRVIDGVMNITLDPWEYVVLTPE